MKPSYRKGLSFRLSRRMKESDLQDHLDHFNDLMELHLVPEMAKCRVFIITLTNWAKNWLKTMASMLIISWQQLSTSFLWQFQATKKFVIPLAHLGNVKQKKGERLKSYLNHFTEESAYVMWVLDAGVLAHLTNRVLLETHFGTNSSRRSARV